MDRAVQRDLQRRQAELVSEIGVDEKAFREGHSYLTLVNDLLGGACAVRVSRFTQKHIGSADPMP